MTAPVVLVAMVTWSPPAHACPAHMEDETLVEAELEDLAVPAQSPELLGRACSYSTGVMARRVLADGDIHDDIGALERVDGDDDAKVATPFRLGDGIDAHVVATALLERLVAEGLDTAELHLQGKMLEVGGRRYLVLTSYRPANI